MGASRALMLLAVMASVAAMATSYQIVCYYANWPAYRHGDGKYEPKDVDPGLCTQIIYSFAILDESSLTMVSHDKALDEDRGFFKQIVALKQKNRDLKVLLAIGGWTDSQPGDKYSRMVGDKNLRSNFIQKALAMLQKFGFDGLDLDWEYPKTSDKANFITLIKELKEAFKPFNLLVTAAVAAPKWKIDEAYDVRGMGQYLDQIHIMAYDYHGAWDGRTGHHAPLYDIGTGHSTEATVNYYIQQGAPAKKLILGMPLYGKTWTLANPAQNGLGAGSAGVGQAGTFTGEGGLLAYYEICAKQWTVVKDSSGKRGPYAYNGNQWVSYDDVSIIKIKSEYVKSKGLGGAMIWELDQDDFSGKFCGQGTYPLLKSINSVLKGTSGPTGPVDPIPPAPEPVPDPPSNAGNGGNNGGNTGGPGNCSQDGFYANTKDCNKYYRCVSGIKYEQSCPPGLHFGPACDCCTWPAESGCRS